MLPGSLALMLLLAGITWGSAGCDKAKRAPRGDGAVDNDGEPIDVLPIDVSVLGAGSVSNAPGVSTISGSAVEGFVDGPGATALFSDPVNVAFGPDGYLYVADFKNGSIRRLTVDGEARTLARGLTGPAGLAFDGTEALVVSGDDGFLRRIDLATGTTAVLASGLGLARGVVALPDGRFVATALDGHVLWVIQPDGSKSILAGAAGEPGFMDATGAAARFNQPVDVVLMAADVILVADLGNDRLRSVTFDGVVQTFAGTAGGFRDGPLSVAQFDGPSGLALDGLGNLWVSDRFNYRIREITVAGQVITLAGDGTLGYADASDPLAADFAAIEGIDFSAPGVLYIADGNALRLGGFHRIRSLRVAP
jgi:hypothetical protein